MYERAVSRVIAWTRREGLAKKDKYSIELLNVKIMLLPPTEWHYRTMPPFILGIIPNHYFYISSLQMFKYADTIIDQPRRMLKLLNNRRIIHMHREKSQLAVIKFPLLIGTRLKRKKIKYL